MSEVFEGYERQYCEASASLSRKCTAASALDGERKKQKLSEIQSGVEEAESLIRKMDLEARSLQPSIKAGLLAKLREYKSDLNNVKSELKRISAPNARQATREELLESGMADTLAVSTDQRGRLMMTTERLNQSTDRIKESRRTMLETEELGVSILQDLHQQRQSLLHAHTTVRTYPNNAKSCHAGCWATGVGAALRAEGEAVVDRGAWRAGAEHLHGVDDNIGKSKKILAAMSKRMDRNKWIIGGIITALALAILFILYFKLAH
ncbi:hypothetical protein Zm00014a_014090 [Zea mays]|uniref:Vesicle transport v-SNARE 13 n=1 Tax=Zea mays TaxID=4577 RepID=A0A3L6DL64_MAIZE|nr:Vesicle transport v-SNARE 13 [Zea mays]PWZ08793.1 hypothetical protein Zm00014a_014090 [Zea mays]